MPASKTKPAESPKQKLEDIIEALSFRDIEVVEAYALINQALVAGRPSGKALHRRMTRGDLLERVEMDLEEAAELLSRHQVRKLRRLLERYEEFRADCLAFVAGMDRMDDGTRAIHGRLSQEVVDLVTFMEDLKEQAWDRYAATDELTGLLNRTALDDIVAQERRRARRSKSPIALALVDADRFKAINDEYGHDAGDAVLVEMARRIDSNVRAHDYVVRYGGEEILVFMPRAGRADARRILERVRRLFAKRSISIPGGLEIAVTVSIGFTELNPKGAVDDAFKAADLALYEAKEGGRNRTVFKATPSA